MKDELQNVCDAQETVIGDLNQQILVHKEVSEKQVVFTGN